jgi:Protein of unknown function (DUF1761)
MQINWIVVASCALIPLIVGFIWYSKALFGHAWMSASGMTVDKAKTANMPKMLGFTFVMGLIIASAMLHIVIHQMGVYSVFGGVGNAELSDPSSATSIFLHDFMSKYGQNFRTFKHGALHGAMAGLFIAMPAIAIPALFEMKSFKYVAINAGYWVVTLALIGGVICQWA